MSGRLVLLYAAPERVITPRFLAQLDSLHERGLLEPVRHRRGALREPVGPRLPRGLPRPVRAARALSRRAAHRADRHRRRRSRAPTSSSGCSSRTRACSSAASTGPNIRYTIVEKDNARAQLLRFMRDEHDGRGRHRLLPVAQEGRRDGRLARRRGHRRPALPRRPGRRTCAAPPGPLPARGRHGDGRDDRLRHGHRQARRALRRPPRPAEEHRELLPGDRPRRPRRRCRPTPGWPTAWPTWSTSAA